MFYDSSVLSSIVIVSLREEGAADRLLVCPRVVSRFLFFLVR